MYMYTFKCNFFILFILCRSYHSYLLVIILLEFYFVNFLGTFKKGRETEEEEQYTETKISID